MLKICFNYAIILLFKFNLGGVFVNRKRVLVAMSGGVDSSVAALKLKNMGYYCVGATIIMSKPDGVNSLKYVEDAAYF